MRGSIGIEQARIVNHTWRTNMSLAHIDAVERVSEELWNMTKSDSEKDWCWVVENDLKTASRLRTWAVRIISKYNTHQDQDKSQKMIDLRLKDAMCRFWQCK